MPSESSPLLPSAPPSAPLTLPPLPRPQPPPFIDPLSLSSTTRAGILAGVWTATFLASLNTTMVATLLTSISSEYDAANEASWLGTSYLLATATFTPLYGRLCNVIGRKGANQLALVMLFVGTVGCGVARSMEQLIAARFLAGMGGGGIFTTASIIQSDIYDMRSRSMTQGIGSIFSGLGMGIGGLSGDWWRIASGGGGPSSLPLFFVSFSFTQHFLLYHTPGKLRTPLSIVSRIDYFGSLSLLFSIGCGLFSLSYRYNQDIPFSDSLVWGTTLGCAVGAVAFVVLELGVAVEPVLAPQLLKMKVPVLVGISSLLVPCMNFATMYFFPLFFEVVENKSSSEAGLHLLPNSIAMSLGSLFAGYVMQRTGRYKTLNLVFGILPFVAAMLIARIKPDSGVITQWISIIPLGFGNAVVLQTTLIALLVSIDNSQLAVGTGFIQLFRGIGQVLGVAVPSAIFQSQLDRELKKRIKGPDAPLPAQLIQQIRHDSRVINTLSPALQVEARGAFAVSLRQVFIFGAICTGLAFIVRLGIPEASLDSQPHHEETDSEYDPSEAESSDDETATARASSVHSLPLPHSSSATNLPTEPLSISASPRRRPLMRPRRLSTYESDHSFDPEPNAFPRSYKSSASIRSSSGRLSRASSANPLAVGSVGRTSTFGGVLVAEEPEEDEEV